MIAHLSIIMNCIKCSHNTCRYGHVSLYCVIFHAYLCLKWPSTYIIVPCAWFQITLWSDWSWYLDNAGISDILPDPSPLWRGWYPRLKYRLSGPMTSIKLMCTCQYFIQDHSFWDDKAVPLGWITNNRVIILWQKLEGGNLSLGGGKSQEHPTLKTLAISVWVHVYHC